MISGEPRNDFRGNDAPGVGSSHFLWAALLDIPRTLLYDLGYYHALVAMRGGRPIVRGRLAGGWRANEH